MRKASKENSAHSRTESNIGAVDARFWIKRRRALKFKRCLLLPEHQTPIGTRSPPRELRTARETKRSVVQRHTMWSSRC